VDSYKNILVNDKKIQKVANPDSASGYFYDANQEILTVLIGRQSVTKKITVRISK
jgi:hypothetical protein